MTSSNANGGGIGEIAEQSGTKPNLVANSFANKFGFVADCTEVQSAGG